MQLGTPCMPFFPPFLKKKKIEVFRFSNIFLYLPYSTWSPFSNALSFSVPTPVSDIIPPTLPAFLHLQPLIIPASAFNVEVETSG